MVNYTCIFIEGVEADAFAHHLVDAQADVIDAVVAENGFYGFRSGGRAGRATVLHAAGCCILFISHIKRIAINEQRLRWCDYPFARRLVAGVTVSATTEALPCIKFKILFDFAPD